MNRYKYEEININDEEYFNVVITDEMLDKFRTISGDINPLHSDDEFARIKGYNSKVVFGMLTSSFYSTLAGVYLPGENSLIHNIEIKFNKPVYVGDELQIKGIVLKKYDKFNLLRLEATIFRTNTNEKVSSANISVGVTSDIESLKEEI